MATDSKPTLTPKLRFPEFQDEPGWEEKTLGKLFSERDETGYTDLQLLSLTEKEGIIPQEDSNRKNNASIDRAKYLRVVPGDIAYNTMRMWEGRSAFARLEGVVSPAYTVCKPTEDADGLFFSYYFKTQQLIREFARYSQGLVKDTLNLKFEAFSRISVAAPRSTEQQKIAECLSTLDELIGAEIQKLDAIKAHKKGLLQQLFPREGETLPWLRFPEFQNAPEWEVKKLEEVGRVIRGASPRPKGDPRYYGGPVPRLMVQDVTRDGKWVTPRIDSLTQEGARLSRPCPAGTLTIVCSGAVGVVSFLAVDACIHDGFLALIDIDELIVIKDFLFHSLSTLRDQFERGATHGGVFTNLTTTGIEQFEITCPKPPEQQRIATCLSSLDDLIAAQSDKIEALRTHKKGLMQQLFPFPPET